jgi:hypothetical protein
VQKWTSKTAVKNPPKNGPKTSSTILQFTTIFINFFNLQDEVKGEQGLAALALGKFAKAA